MDSLTTFFQTVLHQWPWLPGMLALQVKGGLLLLLALGISVLARKQAASYRHLVWFAVLLILLFLPVLAGRVPALNIQVPENSVWLLLSLDNRAAPAELPDTSVLSMTGNSLIWTSLVMTSGFLLHTVISLIRIAGITHRALPLKEKAGNEQLTALLAREGMTQKITLLRSAEIDSPLSWGFFRPVILCPPSAREWTPEKWHSVLAHELSHIERCDWLSLVLGRIVLALYWYNPLVWLALHKMNEEAELACDDAVVLEQNNTDYADALVSLARNHKSNFRKTALAKAMANSFLGKRVASVLDTRLIRIRSENLFLIRAALLGLSLGAVVASIEFEPEERFRTVSLQLTRPLRDQGPRDKDLLRSSLSPFEAAVRPDRSVFDEVPDLPLIETVVSRSRIKGYLDSFAPNAEGNIPDFVLQELGVIDSSGNSRVLLSQGVPVYPQIAKRGNIAGYVVIEFEIHSSGAVGNARVIDSDPARIFDRSALEAIYQNRYTPQLQNQQDVPVVIQQTRYIFQLQPEPG